MITRSSFCQPWTSDGVMSFHFCLDNVILLGSSTLNCSTKGDDVVQKVNLLIAVDEEAGGALADGFEWVCVISGLISSLKSLYQTLCSAQQK
jgi:hypothetical protein